MIEDIYTEALLAAAAYADWSAASSEELKGHNDYFLIRFFTLSNPSARHS